MSSTTQQQDSRKTTSPSEFSVKVEEHCIGCSTCVQVCEPIFALTDGTLDDQKSFVKEGVHLSSHEATIDDAVEMCPVTAIIKTTT